MEAPCTRVDHSQENPSKMQIQVGSPRKGWQDPTDCGAWGGLASLPEGQILGKGDCPEN